MAVIVPCMAAFRLVVCMLVMRMLVMGVILVR